MASGNSSFDFLNEDAKPANTTAPLIAQCPHCSGKMKVPAKMAGKKVRCPKCQQGFTLPGAAAGSSPATPPPRKSKAAAEPDNLPTLTSVTVQISGARQGRMIMKGRTKVEAIPDGLTFTMKTLSIKAAVAIVLGAIVFTLLCIATVVGTCQAMGVNDGGLLPLVLAVFALPLLIFIGGLFAGWFKFLGKSTAIELTKDMPIQVKPGPEAAGLYHIVLKEGSDKLLFMVLESQRRELREFIANTLNKTAPV